MKIGIICIFILYVYVIAGAEASIHKEVYWEKQQIIKAKKVMPNSNK